MPPTIRTWSATSELSGIGGSELQNPAPNALVGNIEAAFGEKVLDITEAQRETAIQPNRVLDDGWRKSVTFVRNLAHPPRLGLSVRRRQGVNLSKPPKEIYHHYDLREER
jgi:hypothetical protein